MIECLNDRLIDPNREASGSNLPRPPFNPRPSAVFVCQAFITNSSVRENVLLGSPMDLSRYQRTLRCCALLPDLTMLPHGDATLIGSKGTQIK